MSPHKALRGTEALYAGYPRLIYYSKLYNGRRVKDLDELQNRWIRLDSYVNEKQAELNTVLRAEREVTSSLLQTDTLRSVFGQAIARLKRDLAELEKEREMVADAKDDFLKWQQQSGSP